MASERIDARDRLERAFARWGHLVYRRAGRTLAAALLVIAALASQLPRIEIDTSTEGFLHEDDPIRITYDRFREQFGRDERILLALRPPAVFDPEFLAELRAIHREIEREVPKLREVTSLVNVRNTRGRGDELIVEGLLDDWPQTPEELAAIEQIALAKPLYRNLLISEDGRLTAIIIETDAYSSLGAATDELAGFDDSEGSAGDDPPPRRFLTGQENSAIVEALQDIVDRHADPDLEIYLAGTPPMVDGLNKAMQSDMIRFTALAIAAIAALLFLLFRRLAAVVLPLVVVTLSLLCTLSVMAISGVPLSLPTQILPSFLLAVGVGNSVHILVIFFQRRALGEDEETSIAFALGHSGLAIVMTSLTTAGGLASFAAAELAPIAEFGVFAPLGVMIALLLTVLLLPALIAISPLPVAVAEATGPRRSQRLLVRAGEFATDHAPAIAMATAGLMAIAALGAAQLRFSHDPIAWFPEDNSLRISTETINDSLKGSTFIELLIETGEENGLHDPELLNRMDEMRRYASRTQMGDIFVGKTISLLDVLKEIHQALNENRSEFYAIPQDRALVAQELLLFESSGSDDLEDLVDPQFSTARLTMKLPLADAIQYAPYIEKLDQNLTRILGDAAALTLTGVVAVAGRTIRAVIRSMAKTYVVAFLVITPLMILLVGDLKIGLLSMVPNLVPILATLGLMGWTGLSLDAFTLLIGSIAIGLAVDDTIHFMHNFRRYHGRSGRVGQAVRETLSSTGQALLFTSLVLCAGFFIYMLASMNNLFYFGFLTGFTIAVAFLADVLLAPALLALVMRPETTRALDRGIQQCDDSSA